MLLKTWSRSILPTLLLLALPVISMAQVSLNISVNTPPPELPVYDQPPIPGDGYLWTPGYWAWGDDIQDYYWVPGTWVQAPQPGYLWTPGYWGWQGGAFLWNAGYWGQHVGFYGGVAYGYGYGGSGFEGGYWQGGHLYYNRSVTNISTTNITNVYNKTVINNVTETHVSYNGGTGGVRAQPSSAEQAAAHEQHIAAVPAQRQQEQAARSNPALHASNNKGKPPIAATARPGAFSGAGVVAAKKGGAVSEVHAKPEAEAEPKSEPKSQPRPQTQPEREAAPKAAQKAEPRPEARPEREAAPKAAQKAEPRPEARPEREAAPKAEPKVTAKAPPKAAPKAEPQPKPEHPDDREHH